MGLPPVRLKEDYETELKRRVIGFRKDPLLPLLEIGIDLYWDKTFLNNKNSFPYAGAVGSGL